MFIMPPMAAARSSGVTCAAVAECGPAPLPVGPSCSDHRLSVKSWCHRGVIEHDFCGNACGMYALFGSARLH